MLIDMLRQSKDLDQDPVNLEVILKLADAFESDTENLYRSPEELAEHLQIGSKQRWKEFLRIPQVQSFIDAEVKEANKVNFRKGLKAISQSAEKGDNAQFSKQLTELSGIFDKQDNQKIIVLHQVSRPSFENSNPQEVINNES